MFSNMLLISHQSWSVVHFHYSPPPSNMFLPPVNPHSISYTAPLETLISQTHFSSQPTSNSTLHPTSHTLLTPRNWSLPLCVIVPFCRSYCAHEWFWAGNVPHCPINLPRPGWHCWCAVCQVGRHWWPRRSKACSTTGDAIDNNCDSRVH